MQRENITTIANARSALEKITSRNQKFLQHVAAHKVAPEILASLEIAEDRLEIDCFGHLATATPRPVRSVDDLYFMEYVFIVQYAEKEIEVTRFYLSDHGNIVDKPSSLDAICDYKNLSIARHLCGRALLGALKSALFSPSQDRS
jgi:hypothetical protein